MSRKRNQKPQTVKQVPLKGALTVDDSPESMALKILLDRMDAYERENRAVMQALLTQTQTDSIRLWGEIRAMKEETAAAINETRARLQALMESRPMDQNTLKAMLESVQAEADRQIKEGAVRFSKLLEDCPKGEVISTEQETVRFIINGHSWLIQPGLNKDVPQPYIEAWERRTGEKAWVKEYEAAFRRPDPKGQDVSLPNANYIQALRGMPPIWDTNTGRL